jgi:hypothetical protein
MMMRKSSIGSPPLDVKRDQEQHDAGGHKDQAVTYGISGLLAEEHVERCADSAIAS